MVILTAYKGVEMVVLDNQDYINKAKDILSQKDTYRPSTVDPTTIHKNKFINILRTIMAQCGLGDNT